MSVHNDELYQEVILEHNKHPRNFRKIDPCSHQAEGYNPLCGDHLKVYLQVSAEGRIEDLAFEGDGCAISKASASMMTAVLKGRSVEEARALFEEFRGLVMKELDPQAGSHHLGKLTVFSGIWKYPSRVKCAILAWHTLKGALDKTAVVSTE
ncbi:MAG: SUF system NifU family Fe-S cluster assembly protein [Elusimicrobia bacterium]|nr:SUF system NifU family Fe-S cluster assembly protein [Elusimicrobiota bacterium]